MDKITKRKGHKHKNQPNRKLTKKPLSTKFSQDKGCRWKTLDFNVISKNKLKEFRVYL